MTENRPLFEQAVAAARQKDFTSARTLLRQLLKQEPTNVNAWLLAAHVVETRPDAIACYRRVLQLDPGHAYARQKLSELEGQPPGAAREGPSTARPAIQLVSPAVPPGPPVVQPPEGSRMQPVIPPHGQAPTPTKSKTGNRWIVLSMILLGVFCLVAIGIAILSPDGLPFGNAKPTPSADELFNVLYRNARAANEENVVAYMATIHPDSPMYEQTQAALVDIFSQYDLEFRFYDLALTRLRSNEARIHFSLSTRKINGPDFRDNVAIGTIVLRLKEGEWLIFDQLIEDVQY